MKKPKLKKVAYLDYNECIDFINKKYNIDADDYAGTFTTTKEDIDAKAAGDAIDPSGKWWGGDPTKHTGDQLLAHQAFMKIYETKKDKPFLSFWHWVLDAYGVSNGSDLTFDNEGLEMCDDRLGDLNDDKPGEEYAGWRKKIYEYFLIEFGKGKNREVKMRVEW